MLLFINLNDRVSLRNVVKFSFIYFDKIRLAKFRTSLMNMAKNMDFRFYLFDFL